MFKKKKTKNEKSELQLLVPYEDFIEGQRAIALLEAVERCLGNEIYISTTGLRAILDMPQVVKDY